MENAIVSPTIQIKLCLVTYLEIYTIYLLSIRHLQKKNSVIIHHKSA